MQLHPHHPLKPEVQSETQATTFRTPLCPASCTADRLRYRQGPVRRSGKHLATAGYRGHPGTGVDWYSAIIHQVHVQQLHFYRRIEEIIEHFSADERI
jgi:hypothetical protein